MSSSLSPQRMLQCCVRHKKTTPLCNPLCVGGMEAELREPKILSRPHLHLAIPQPAAQKGNATTCSHIRPCRACCLATLLGVNICGRRHLPASQKRPRLFDDDKGAICHLGLAGGEHTCVMHTNIYLRLDRAGAKACVCVIGTSAAIVNKTRTSLCVCVCVYYTVKFRLALLKGL